MARLLWGKDTLVCISDSEFVVLCQRQTESIIYRELRKRQKSSLPSTSCDSGTSVERQKQKSETTKEQTHEESDSGHSPTGRILACGFSASARYFALCDDYKTLSVYDTQGWKLLSTRETQKRCMAVTFNHAEDVVYVADRFGDVYRYSVLDEPNAEGLLLLGHLSMLLDMAISPDDKLILTADRDEKIRVSCLPNAYNIHSFCLGHTEFVSRIAIVPGFEHVLVTGGGDCTLRFWDYRDGKQLRCIPLLTPDDDDEEEDTKDQQVVVTGITCCHKHGLIAVTVYGLPRIFLFRVVLVKLGGSCQLIIETPPYIDTKAVCWSACFDHQDHLWVLRQQETYPIIVYAVVELSSGIQLEALKTSGDSANIVRQLNSDWSFFKDAVNSPSPYINLYKKSFDNAKVYYERKEQRIREQQQKKASKKPAFDLPVGKKPKLELTSETADCKDTE